MHVHCEVQAAGRDLLELANVPACSALCLKLFLEVSLQPLRIRRYCVNVTFEATLGRVLLCGQTTPARGPTCPVPGVTVAISASQHGVHAPALPAGLLLAGTVFFTPCTLMPACEAT